MTFHVGQKVAPIVIEGLVSNGTMPLLDINAVYVVREIDLRAVNAGCPGHDVACVRVVGVYGAVSPTSVGMWENGYRADGFRPIVERKTDISIFKAMLTPQGVDA